MIQLSTQPLAGIVPAVRAAGFPLGTTSDFALALADLANAAVIPPALAVPPGGAVPTPVSPLDTRQPVAGDGKDLPTPTVPLPGITVGITLPIAQPIPATLPSAGVLPAPITLELPPTPVVTPPVDVPDVAADTPASIILFDSPLRSLRIPRGDLGIPISVLPEDVTSVPVGADAKPVPAPRIRTVAAVTPPAVAVDVATGPLETSPRSRARPVAVAVIAIPVAAIPAPETAPIDTAAPAETEDTTASKSPDVPKSALLLTQPPETLQTFVVPTASVVPVTTPVATTPPAPAAVRGPQAGRAIAVASPAKVFAQNPSVATIAAPVPSGVTAPKSAATDAPRTVVPPAALATPLVAAPVAAVRPEPVAVSTNSVPAASAAAGFLGVRPRAASPSPVAPESIAASPRTVSAPTIVDPATIDLRPTSPARFDPAQPIAADTAPVIGAAVLVNVATAPATRVSGAPTLTPRAAERVAQALAPTAPSIQPPVSAVVGDPQPPAPAVVTNGIPTPVIAASLDRPIAVATAIEPRAPASAPAAIQSTREIAPAPVSPVAVTVVALPATLPPAPQLQPAAQAFAAAMFAAAAPVDTPRDEPTDEFSLALVSGGTPTALHAPAIAVAATAQGQQPALDMARHDWMASMIDRIETLRDESGGVRETRMRLAPEALGNVEVSVRRDESGVMQVRIAADTPQARAILADAAPRLAEMAEARGVKLGGSSVDANPNFADHSRRDTPAAPVPRAPRPVTATTATDDTDSDTRIA